MSNSPLVNYTKISPNKNSPRNNKIDKITIHHMAGNLTVEACGNVFASSSRQASSNYGVGTDGRIGLYVEEKDRSWCSSSPENDHRAVTIEVANDGGAPDWHVSDKALEATINLCVDICKRNGIKKLNFTGDKNGNLTQHNYFANTTCPGPYLSSKFPYIADEVNKRLNNSSVIIPPTATKPTKFKVGDKVIINGDLYKSANASYPVSKIVNKITQITRVATGTAHPYNTTGDLGWMNESDIKAYSNSTVSVPSNSGFKVGDTVKIRSGWKDWNGKYLAGFAYNTPYKIMEIGKSNPNRIVIGEKGVVIAAIHKDGLYKIK